LKRIQFRSVLFVIGESLTQLAIPMDTSADLEVMTYGADVQMIG
jgi:hypothetical protein